MASIGKLIKDGSLVVLNGFQWVLNERDVLNGL